MEYNKKTKRFVSVSAIAEYTYCPKKTYYKYVLGIKEPLNKQMLRGRIAHELKEELHNRLSFIITLIKRFNAHEVLSSQTNMLIDRVIEKNKNDLIRFNFDVHSFKTYLLRILQPVLDELEKNINTLIILYSVEGKALLKFFKDKLLFENPVESEKFMIKGRTDLIVVNSSINIIEFKTGALPKSGVWESHVIQTGAYIMMYKDMFKNKPVKGFVEYIDFNKRIEIPYNDFLKNKILMLRDKVLSLFNKEPDGFNDPDNKKCLNCFYRDKCY